MHAAYRWLMHLVEKTVPTTPFETGPSAESLAAMKMAHANPKPLSPEGAQEFHSLRSRSWLQRLATICRYRRGRMVFRVTGRAGADLPCHPAEWANHQALLRFQRLLGKVFRRPPQSALGVQSRKAKADARAQRVLAVYPRYQLRGRHAAALIARETGESRPYVRRVLRENVHDRQNQ